MLKRAVMGVMLVAGANAQAETLRIETIYPAASNEAAAMHTIAIDHFAGREGRDFANRIEHRLIDAAIDGQPFFTLVHRSQADSADAILDGDARVRVTESEFSERRKLCVEEDDKGQCLRREKVDLSCLRLAVDIRPRANLRSADGTILWSSLLSRNEVLSYCPGYDDEPLVAPVVDIGLAAAADDVRRALAPVQAIEDIRIMERRKGMSGDASGAFREAVRLTKQDERAACDAFAALEPAIGTHPSLLFNLGLCAEQAGDFATAERYYLEALADKTSDDEAQAGLRRIDQTIVAERQLESRETY
ncbi:tetratricopeptide repeat protein [Alteriqipengyuania lutimaris]|nr:hypothetical protein [Alteriqipengyuania lutimaris]MBB3032605.1 hypothetical protein [Alteriqipengyuania lutimaris]